MIISDLTPLQEQQGALVAAAIMLKAFGGDAHRETIRLLGVAASNLGELTARAESAEAALADCRKQWARLIRREQL